LANDTSFFTGFGGDATINNKTFPVKSWQGRFPVTIVPFINSKSGGHIIRASTSIDWSATIVIDWNLSDQPFQSSQGTIVPGTLVTNIYLKISADANDGWMLTNGIVADTPQGLSIAGTVETTLSLLGNGGTITPPNSTAY
jgi:hypothetical protein